MITFLVSHGASLTIANNQGLTPVQLASHLNDPDIVDALQAITQKPLPPAAPAVYLCLKDLVLVRWNPPMDRQGVPVATLYEVEATNSDGAKVSLAKEIDACCGSVKES